jgi:hypothetical protein
MAVLKLRARRMHRPFRDRAKGPLTFLNTFQIRGNWLEPQPAGEMAMLMPETLHPPGVWWITSRRLVCHLLVIT